MLVTSGCQIAGKSKRPVPKSTNRKDNRYTGHIVEDEEYEFPGFLLLIISVWHQSEGKRGRTQK